MVLASKFTANERLLRKRLAARLRQRRCRERKREALLQKNHPELGTKSARGSTAVVDAASRGSSPASTMGRTTPPVQQPLKERLESSESMGPCYAMGLGHYPMRNGYSYQSPHGVSAGSPGGTFDARIPPPCPSSRYETSASRVTLENPATAVLIKASNLCAPPAPVSPGSSMSVSPSPVAVSLPPLPSASVPKETALASQEMAAIDAMLALRCKTSHDADGEAETASTSSLSTKESGSPHPKMIPKAVVVVTTPDTRVKDYPTIPETVVYRPKYAMALRPPTQQPLPSYQYPPAPYHQHRPLAPPPPQPWGYHHYPPYPYHHPAHHHAAPPVPYWKAGPSPVVASSFRGAVQL